MYLTLNCILLNPKPKDSRDRGPENILKIQRPKIPQNRHHWSLPSQQLGAALGDALFELLLGDETTAGTVTQLILLAAQQGTIVEVSHNCGQPIHSGTCYCGTHSIHQLTRGGITRLSVHTSGSMLQLLRQTLSVRLADPEPQASVKFSSSC